MKTITTAQCLSPVQKALGVCALASTFLFSAPAFAQVVNYTWTGASSNTWAISGNWTKDGTGTHPGSDPAGTMANTTATVDGSRLQSGSATVNITTQVLFFGNGIAGTYETVRLINNATVNASAAFRVGSNAGVTRDVLIDSTSKFISTAATNGVQLYGVDDTISTWTIQGELKAVTLTFTNLPAANSGMTGGFIMNVAGGTVDVSQATNLRFPGTGSSVATGQFNISNNGFLNLGAISNLGHSSNFYINFADGSGEFNFLTGSNYTTRSSVEALINGGKIRLGGNIVDSSSFTINDTGTGWQLQAVPEPSTYALLAGVATLGAVVLVKRRRR